MVNEKNWVSPLMSKVFVLIKLVKFWHTNLKVTALKRQSTEPLPATAVKISEISIFS